MRSIVEVANVWGNPVERSWDDVSQRDMPFMEWTSEVKRWNLRQIPNRWFIAVIFGKWRFIRLCVPLFKEIPCPDLNSLYLEICSCGGLTIYLIDSEEEHSQQSTRPKHCLPFLSVDLSLCNPSLQAIAMSWWYLFTTRAKLFKWFIMSLYPPSTTRKYYGPFFFLVLMLFHFFFLNCGLISLDLGSHLCDWNKQKHSSSPASACRWQRRWPVGRCNSQDRHQWPQRPQLSRQTETLKRSRTRRLSRNWCVIKGDFYSILYLNTPSVISCSWNRQQVTRSVASYGPVSSKWWLIKKVSEEGDRILAREDQEKRDFLIVDELLG